MMYVNYNWQLPDRIKNRLRTMTPNFGFGIFGQIVYYRSYSRVKDDGSQEHWADTVIRVIEGIMSVRFDWYVKNNIQWDNDLWVSFAEEMAISMYNMNWLPPGRGLWAMGSNMMYERGSMCLYNCAYSNIGGNTWIEDLCWIKDVLMCGVGVGFCSQATALTLRQPSDNEQVFVVPDSREGWVDSLRSLLYSYTPDSHGCKITFDYSKVRPKGSPIKGFGGTASGPAPLKILHEQARKTCDLYVRKKISVTRLFTDIANMIGVCVVAGNVRRSAEIALGNINDDEFLDLKDYNKYPERGAYGWMSNNSVILHEDEDFDKLGEIASRVINNGEPGYINLRNFKYGRLNRHDKAPEDLAVGINPCITYNSLVRTKGGLSKFGECQIGDYIWSEMGWTKIINYINNGVRDVYKYTTTAGCFYGTKEHQILCEGVKVPINDAYGIDILQGPSVDIRNILPEIVMDGLVLGDGYDYHGKIVLCIGQNDKDYFESEISHLILNERKTGQYEVNTNIYELPPIREYRTIPDKYLYGDTDVICSFLRGLYSANGTVINNRIQLKSISLKLIEQVQVMLSSVGIRSYYTTNKAHSVIFDNGEYTCKESYDLHISVDRHIFMQLIGFIQKYKFTNVVNTDKIKNTYDIVKVEYIGQEEVFDITVNNCTHTFWCNGLNVSNCGEIPLENKEVCNVADTLPTRCKDTNTWLRACQFATFYTSTVSLLPTHHTCTNAVVTRNRRIGVGIIDFAGWKESQGLNSVIKFMRSGYSQIKHTNSQLAKEAGVRDSIRVTTIKPGGSTTKIAGRQPGIGHPNFDFMLRRIRIQKGHPIETLLKEANIPWEPCADQPDFTIVFEIPVYMGETRTIQDVSLWEQAMNLVTVQREWADNAVSNTLVFKGSEENIIEYVLSSIAPVTKSVSLLKYCTDAYRQMPEEGISQNEYYERINRIKPIDWSNFRNSDGIDEKFCDGDKCSV